MTESSKEIALKVFNNLGDPATLERYMAPDARWWAQGQGEMPAKQFFEQAAGFMKSLKKPIEMQIHGITAEGERVAIEAESHGDLPNGKHYNNTYHFLFVVRDGKVVSVKEYNDTKHVADVFGF